MSLMSSVLIFQNDGKPRVEKKYYAVLAIILQAVGIFIGGISITIITVIAIVTVIVIVIVIVIVLIIKRLIRFAIVFQLSPGSFALLTIYRVNFAISTVFVAVSVHCTASTCQT